MRTLALLIGSRLFSYIYRNAGSDYKYHERDLHSCSRGAPRLHPHALGNARRL
jgi:hypothetical protein